MTNGNGNGHSKASASDVTQMLTLLGRIDERTRIQAQEAIETRRAIAELPDKFASKEEVKPLKWFFYTVIGLVISGLLTGAIALLFRAAQ